MIIRKYVVSDMKEAIVRAKYELGKDAMILDHRPVKVGKWFNPFKKQMLEVTVAVEESRQSKELSISNEVIKPLDLIREHLESDKLFKDASDSFKERLIGYCKLNLKENCKLETNEIKDFLKIAYRGNCLEKEANLGKINVFIGPTGVGKTTTIAKIAALKYLMDNVKVGLITIDTYRIGAIEQLKTYANILGVPFEVAENAEDIDRMLKRLNYCDMILIDTVGTSYKSKDKLNEIKSYIDNIDDEKNVYLVVSISTDEDTIKSILDEYKYIGYDALILTKLDEVSNLYNFWNFVEHNEYPIEYFCSGQDVPEDIQDAIVENLIGYFKENI